MLKKIKKIAIGTNNKGKLREIKNLLPKNIKTLSTFHLKIKSPRENGKNFQQNSLIKSKYFSKKKAWYTRWGSTGENVDKCY